MSDQPVIRRDGATSPIIKNLQRSYIMTNQSQAGSDLTLTRSQSLYEEAQTLLPGGVNSPARAFRGVGGNPRSEEHTSELQSHLNLVCRLLLEKKKLSAYCLIHHV